MFDPLNTRPRDPAPSARVNRIVTIVYWTAIAGVLGALVASFVGI